MCRTEQLHGLRLMKFEDACGRSYRGEMSQSEAADVLGIGRSGIIATVSRPMGRQVCTTAVWAGHSARHAGVDGVMAVLDLFDTRYADFTAKHF